MIIAAILIFIAAILKVKQQNLQGDNRVSGGGVYTSLQLVVEWHQGGLILVGKGLNDVNSWQNT